MPKPVSARSFSFRPICVTTGIPLLLFLLSLWLQWQRFCAGSPSRRNILCSPSRRAHSDALHIHQNEDEHFIVLQGTVRIVCGDRNADVTTGTVLTVPKGTPHAWANLSGPPVRMLAVFTPSGVEGFFRELAAVDSDGIEAVARAYGCSIVPAPHRGGGSSTIRI
jgi:mannose-6-phosphate isomerase-like protein (cupin superfamily)